MAAIKEEPRGLNMALDDIIKEEGHQRQRKRPYGDRDRSDHRDGDSKHRQGGEDRVVTHRHREGGMPRVDEQVGLVAW